MSETVFDGVTPPSSEPSKTPASQSTQVPTEMLEFIGEGRKYATPEDALKSIPHAQLHIAKIEEENRKMMEELAKRKTAEELIEEFRATGSTKPQGEATPQSTLDPAKLVDLVNSALDQRETAKTAKQNTDTVISAFVEKYGDMDKAKAEFIKLAEDTGVPVVALNRLAETSPKALFKLAGFDAKQPMASGKPTSTLNTEALNQQPKAVDTSAIRVKPGASTQDVLNAWRAAREAVQKENGF